MVEIIAATTVMICMTEEMNHYRLSRTIKMTSLYSRQSIGFFNIPRFKGKSMGHMIWCVGSRTY